jgi:hypothetical protein
MHETAAPFLRISVSPLPANGGDTAASKKGPPHIGLKIRKHEKEKIWQIFYVLVLVMLAAPRWP